MSVLLGHYRLSRVLPERAVVYVQPAACWRPELLLTRPKPPTLSTYARHATVRVCRVCWMLRKFSVVVDCYLYFIHWYCLLPLSLPSVDVLHISNVSIILRTVYCNHVAGVSHTWSESREYTLDSSSVNPKHTYSQKQFPTTLDMLVFGLAWPRSSSLQGNGANC